MVLGVGRRLLREVHAGNGLLPGQQGPGNGQRETSALPVGCGHRRPGAGFPVASRGRQQQVAVITPRVGLFGAAPMGATVPPLPPSAISHLSLPSFLLKLRKFRPFARSWRWLPVHLADCLGKEGKRCTP
jgi:hypothetical protein